MKRRPLAVTGNFPLREGWWDRSLFIAVAIGLATASLAACGSGGVLIPVVRMRPCSLPAMWKASLWRRDSASSMLIFRPLSLERLPFSLLRSAFAGTAAPSGWLLCDGSAINRSTYATLFGIIGTTYGSGDGTTTFNLPDLRGRVAVGLSSGGASLVNALGNNDGRAANIRNVSHHHTYSRPAANNIIQSGANLAVTDGTGNTSGDANNTDYPAYLVVNYIIKT
jgi:microcystin-dependent protein